MPTERQSLTDQLKQLAEQNRNLHLKIDEISRQNSLLVTHIAVQEAVHIENGAVLQCLLGDIAQKLGLDPAKALVRAEHIVKTTLAKTELGKPNLLLRKN